MKIKTFYVPEKEEEIIKLFEDLAWKERTTGSKLCIEAIREYVKNHQNGNPVFTIDQFTESPELKAVPAFFKHITDWDKHMFDLSSKEIKSIMYQAQSISARAKNRLVQRGEPVD